MWPTLASSHGSLQALGAEPSRFRALRAELLARAEATGLPTKDVEAWRYTSVARLGRTPWVHDHGALFEALAAPHLPTLPGSAAEIVLVNGEFSPGLSRLGALERLVRAGSPKDAPAETWEILDPRLWPPLPDAARAATPADGLTPDRVFDALNTAFIQDIVWIDLPAGFELDAPIHVVGLTLGEGQPIAAHPRVVLRAGRGARATVVERHRGVGAHPTFVNTITDLRIGDGAVVDYHLWREGSSNVQHVGLLRATLARDASLRAHLAHLGGAWARQDVTVRFSGTGGELLCTDVVVAGGESHVDHHTWVLHDAPRCTSRELVKGVYAGTARGVFDGLIALAPGAFKSDAELRAKNLLLTPGAQVHAKPELLIHADDVKAAHGCTVGQLDPEQLRYLRSRGIGAAEARSLLTRGFLLDILDEMHDEALRAIVAEQIAAALDGVLAQP